MLLTQKIYWKFFSFIIALFVITNIYGNSFNYFAGGSPIPLAYSNANNFNPAYGIILSKNSITLTTFFHGKDGYYQNIFFGINKLPYSFRANFITNYYNHKSLKLEFAGLLFPDLAVGISMKSFLTGDNKIIFNAGFLWDKKSYIMSITYFNLGSQIVNDQFIKDYGNDFLLKYENPELFFLDKSNLILNEGVISTFIFNYEKKYYFSFSVNQFIDSWDHFIQLDWSSIFWGFVYILPDGSYIGTGTNSDYNSIGAGFLRGKFFSSYVYLWQPKKFSKHIFTLGFLL